MLFRNESRVGAVVVAALLSACGAARVVEQPPPGVQQLSLRGADGATATVAELADGQRATVWVFWAAGCPCVRRYQARIDDLAQRWRPRGVRVIGVDANADETLSDVDAARAERKFSLPVWRDRGGQLAQALAVRTTPTVVVLLPDGRVRYRGWIDNERQPGDPARQPWLDTALEQLLAGDLTPEQRPRWGCPITGGEPADAADPPSDCGCKVHHGDTGR